MASMGPALEIGSLREEMTKFPCRCEVVACATWSGRGNGSLGEVMWAAMAGDLEFRTSVYGLVARQDVN